MLQMEMAQAGAGQIATGIAGLGNRSRLATHRAGLGYARLFACSAASSVRCCSSRHCNCRPSGKPLHGRAWGHSSSPRGSAGVSGFPLHLPHGTAASLSLCRSSTHSHPAVPPPSPGPTGCWEARPAPGAAARAAASRGRRRGVTREQRAGGTQGIAPAPGQQQGRGQAGRALRNIVGSSAPSEVQWGRVSCSRHMGALRTAICQAGEGAAWNMLPLILHISCAGVRMPLLFPSLE